MRSTTRIFLLTLFCLVLCLPGHGVYAFGAGNIPSFAYLEGKAFRHGDIEDTLADLVKRHGGTMAVLGSLVGKKGVKFGGLDIKRVYFGNWLRDYSQAVDVAGLKKMPLQTIINLCMVLGFLAHGYVTDEFEVTVERLGVYIPTEHIDNPKGYGQGIDPRSLDPRLRGPVDPRELDIDSRTGMKNYIANENGSWDTSKALARRVIEKCIYHGRLQRSNGQKHDEYEAYRLLGTALHTLEDFAAHSNFCELSLVSMGYTQVFTHVGDNAKIRTPGGKWVAPLVTGTFGSSDFMHSLLGEATDHISQASVTDLSAELDKANTKALAGHQAGRGGTNTSVFSHLQALVSAIPSGGGSSVKKDMDEMQRIRTETISGTGKPADQLSPQELHSKLWVILSLRDRMVKTIEQTIELIPGLGPLTEKIMDTISVLVFTTLEPLLKPLMTSATAGLQTAADEVIDKNDQYEVFNFPNATDPTHSFLSKDHFSLLLNEPAGNLAKIIVTHAVDLIVRAWDDPNMNVRHVTDDILQCLFHPDFCDGNSKIQREMVGYMHSWINGLGSEKQTVLGRLTKEAVRTHQNTRVPAGGVTVSATTSGFGQNTGYQAQTGIQQYLPNVPGVAQMQSLSGRVSGIGALVGGSSVQGYQQASTFSTSDGQHQHHHQDHHQHNQHHGGHHGGQESHGRRQQDSFATIHAPGYDNGGDDSSLPGFPTIPGLGLTWQQSPHGSSGGTHPVSYPIYQRTSSPFVPSHSPPSFPSMPHESSSHSGYAPSYAPPPIPEPFGFSPFGFPEASDPQYGFANAFPEASQPHGGPHHSHGGRRDGEHRQGEHRH